MTALVLKLIAVVTMLVDHTGCVLWDLAVLPEGKVLLFRDVGRISFPIFAFLAANGWRHTHDRAAYLKRMMAGALVSAVPYSLAFAWAQDTSSLFWNWNLWRTALAALLLGCALYGCLRSGLPKRGWLAGLTAAFLLLPGVSWAAGGVQLLWREQSIFYTLSYALFLLSCRDLVCGRRTVRGELWRLPVLVLFPILYTFDYGILGALLVLGLYLAAGARQTVLVLAAFAVVHDLIPYYGVQNLIFAGCFLLAAIPILLYRGKKGAGRQRWFYAVYPAHLLALGILKILMAEG